MADGLLSSLYKTIPTNIRLLGEQVAGVETPITEKDFSKEELDFIRQQIETKTQSNDKKLAELQSGVPQIQNTDFKQMMQKELNSYLKSKNKTAINYDDYKNASPGEMGWIDSLKQSFNNPEFRVATSLGQYVGFKNPDGTVSVIDKYNWDNEKKLINKLKSKDYPEFMKYALSSPETALASIMASFLPKTKERDVRIKLENPQYQDPFGDTTK